MEEMTFSSVLGVSSRIAETGKVKILRESSKNIVKDIGGRKSGVFVLSGVRGSGKTTALIELYGKERDCLFVNAEILLKYAVPLLDFLQYGYSKGYRAFLIDEVHVIPDWEKDIKIFFDETRSKILVSGSSAIALKTKGSELSRRANFYEMRPLSFREYIFFRTGKLLPQASIKEIIEPDKRRELEKAILPYLNYFSAYLQFDALPAALFEKSRDLYINIVERTIRYDLMDLRGIDASYVENAFRAIKIIATSSPGEISYSGLSSSLGIGIKLTRQIIYSLAETGIIYKIPPYGKGKKAVRKEEKILMPLSFRSALCNSYGVAPEIGALREDFFIQHVGGCRYVKTGKERRTPDFVVDDYIFEVGGPSDIS